MGKDSSQPKNNPMLRISVQFCCQAAARVFNSLDSANRSAFRISGTESYTDLTVIASFHTNITPGGDTLMVCPMILYFKQVY
jgi:hypothetical protein